MALPENIQKVVNALMRAKGFAPARQNFHSGHGVHTVRVTAPSSSGGQPFSNEVCIPGAVFPSPAAKRHQWETPDFDVVSTPENDASALKLAERMLTDAGKNEKAISQLRNGALIKMDSVDDSEAACKAGADVSFCIHSHPDIHTNDDKNRRARLGFGEKDHGPLLYGTPNYIVNHNRDVFVLEYKDGRYQERCVGNAPLGGKRKERNSFIGS